MRPRPRKQELAAVKEWLETCAFLLVGWTVIVAALAAISLVYGVAYSLGGEIGAVITIAVLCFGVMAYAIVTYEPGEES
jgi:predicted membrane channel-forming protein YqfA (hemolysin III family)